MSEEIKFAGISSNSELRDVSFVFRNLYKTGSLSASEVLYQTGRMMPKFRSVLHAGAKQISTKGWSISQALEQVFPAQTMPAIRAGEESGRLTQVFEQIWITAKNQEEINKVLRGLLMPLALILVGVLVSLGFFLFLVPMQYMQMAKGAPMGYEPSSAILLSVELNKAIMQNLEATILLSVVGIVTVVVLLSRQSVQSFLSELVVKLIIKIEPLGIAYANLKFGIMANYLQIVSMAGLDADKRIDLVIDVLPVPLRKAIVLFRSEMMIKGITVAAESEGRDPSDPRHSPIQWPFYIRLALHQADEGTWEGPMREFGDVMIEDGKERFKKQITVLHTVSFLIVGLLIMIPVGLLYGTLGEVLTMRMRML